MEENPSFEGILRDFSEGRILADECFCMVLSLDGCDKTKKTFLQRLNGFKSSNPKLHKQLSDVFNSYFELKSDTEQIVCNFNLPDELDCAVENGFYSSDLNDPIQDGELDFELDTELALNLSNIIFAQENGPSDIVKHKGSYASCLQSTEITPKFYSHSEKPRSDSPHNKVDSVKDDIENDFRSAGSVCGMKQSSCATDYGSLHSGTNKKKKRRKGCIPKQMSNPPVIFWFRRDLRVYDNPALLAAFQTGAAVIPVFLWSETEEGPQTALATGGATKYWLYQALKVFHKDLLDKYNNPLVLRKTHSCLQDLCSIIDETGARKLFMNDVYEPYLKSRDDKICATLKSKGVNCERFHSYLLHDPGSVSTESIGMRGIGSVTHFMECCRQSSTAPLGVPVEPPPALPVASVNPASITPEDTELGKLPKRRDGSVIDWAKDIRASWNFSEDGAWQALQNFLQDGVRRYEKESSRGDQLNTCRLSPYLHFGQISPRMVLNEAKHMKSPKFLRKLAWRDLSYWLLKLFPDLPSEPTRSQYKHQRWSSNKVHLKAWQKGVTGFPLVDAAMRQLWKTGWMNNYMRHVVASFLISYLHITWVEGYRWFQDTLLDADVAINAMMWQNGGMSGLDQWNFVMHPVDAAMTCDPKGDYVRQWVPELAPLPEEYIHQPWKCPPSIMKRCGVQLGVMYPHRIITELEEAREQSLKDVVEVRMKHRELVDPHTGNDLVPLPSGLLLPVITRKEFKYKTSNPESRENPHNAVLRGYRSRKRDELVSYLNERDFMASTMNECATRHERGQRTSKYAVF